jgi:hypothetical protein
MTQQDLGHDLGQDLDAPGELGSLFDASPAPEVQTSAAAEAGFVLGLFAVLAMPFALSLALSVGLAAVALVCSTFGLARASRPGYAGGVLAALGLVLALGTLALVGLRYAGIDTAFGDGAVPTLRDWLDSLNTLLPTP